MDKGAAANIDTCVADSLFFVIFEEYQITLLQGVYGFYQGPGILFCITGSVGAAYVYTAALQTVIHHAGAVKRIWAAIAPYIRFSHLGRRCFTQTACGIGIASAGRTASRIWLFSGGSRRFRSVFRSIWGKRRGSIFVADFSARRRFRGNLRQVRVDLRHRKVRRCQG